MKKVKKIITILLSLILWTIILIMALFAFTTLATKNEQSVARVAGYTPLIVKSDSMKPTFCTGDLIIIKECDITKLKEGDIITFHAIINNEYSLNTHRIVRIEKVDGVYKFITKGDSYDIEDAHVITDGDIVGKYVGHSAVLGKLMGFVSGSAGFMLVIVIPMLLFFLYQIYHLIMISVDLKKAIAIEEAKDKAQAEAQAEAKMAEAEEMLAQANRLKAEMEEKLAQINDNHTI